MFALYTLPRKLRIRVWSLAAFIAAVFVSAAFISPEAGAQVIRATTAVVRATQAALRNSSPRETGAVVWYDAHERCVLTANGATIPEWSDSSVLTVADTLVQSTESLKPTCVSAVDGASAVVRTDGTDDLMSVTQASTLLTGNFTLIWRGAFNSTSTARAIFGQDVGAGGNPKWIFGYDFACSGGKMSFHINDASLAGPGVCSTAWARVIGEFHTWTLQRSGNDYSWFRDGSAWGTQTAAFAFPANTAALTIGYAEGGANYGDVDTRAIAVWTSALSATDRVAAETYIGAH